MDYTVEVEGMGPLRAKLTPDLYQRALAGVLTDAAILGEREARAGAPKDTSELARSITHEVKPTFARVYSTMNYAEVVEKGRGENKPPPPPKALYEWLDRHGIDRQAAFVIARAIGRRGIKGRFFMKNAREKVDRALPGFIAKASAEIRARWGA